MANPNDDAPAQFGIVATMKQRADGSSELRFDDVAMQPTLDAVSWRNVSFYTSTRVTAAELEAMSFSESRLAEIGLTVLVRLAARRERDA